MVLETQTVLVFIV